jgi:beta-xylosidase
LSHQRIGADALERGETVEVTVTVTNTGDRAGDEVVQLYGCDPVASVTRPTVQLLGYQRVHLDPGESATVRFEVPTTRLAFTDRRMVRVVEPGDVEVWVASSAERGAETAARATVRLTGEPHVVTLTDERWVQASWEK